MTTETIRVRAWLIAAALIAAVGIGHMTARPDTPAHGQAAVCHSATEDGTITDCDYRDGGWYRK